MDDPRRLESRVLSQAFRDLCKSLYGEPMHVPSDANENALEVLRKELEARLISSENKSGSNFGDGDEIQQRVFVKTLIGAVVFNDERALDQVGIFQHQTNSFVFFRRATTAEMVFPVRGAALIQARVNIFCFNDFFEQAARAACV